MDVLLIVKDPLTRDQVKVGLQQFPGFTATVGQGYEGVNELRVRRFDCVFLGVDPRDGETMRWLQHMRSFDKTTELVVLANARQVKDMTSEKGKWNIHSFLQVPLDVKEFLGFVGRFVERRSGRPPQKAPARTGVHPARS